MSDQCMMNGLLSWGAVVRFAVEFAVEFSGAHVVGVMSSIVVDVFLSNATHSAQSWRSAAVHGLSDVSGVAAPFVAWLTFAVESGGRGGGSRCPVCKDEERAKSIECCTWSGQRNGR
jgi:hypothetical protein